MMKLPLDLLVSLTKRETASFSSPLSDVTWEMKEVSDTVELTTVTITACTGNISCHPNAVLSVSPVHPHDLTNVKRWPHLPFYADWQLYIRWKAKAFLQLNV
jgi:hypothetical protein